MSDHTEKAASTSSERMLDALYDLHLYAVEIENDLDRATNSGEWNVQMSLDAEEVFDRISKAIGKSGAARALIERGRAERRARHESAHAPGGARDE